MNEQTKPQMMLTDAPESLSKTAMCEFLTEKGAKGIMDATAISQVLGTITPRTIRYYTANGELKPLNPTERWYIYTKESLADFLLKHPKFAMMKQEGWTVDENTVPLIKDAITNCGWNGLKKYMEEDDIVGDVICKLMSSRRSTACSIKTAICRILNDIWRKLKRDPMIKAVPFDENQSNKQGEQE